MGEYLDVSSNPLDGQSARHLSSIAVTPEDRPSQLSAALVGASALLVDYVMTVAVSVVAGVVAITSAVRSLAPFAVGLSVAFVLVLTLANLRGTKESGRAFAVPTYLFIGLMLVMFAVAAVEAWSGTLVLAETAPQPVEQITRLGGAFTLI